MFVRSSLFLKISLKSFLRSTTWQRSSQRQQSEALTSKSVSRSASAWIFCLQKWESPSMSLISVWRYSQVLCTVFHSIQTKIVRCDERFLIHRESSPSPPEWRLCSLLCSRTLFLIPGPNCLIPPLKHSHNGTHCPLYFLVKHFVANDCKLSVRLDQYLST